MADIKLYEFTPTRSSKPRWALLEAGLEYESLGNDPGAIGSEELLKIHPLGKLPGAIIDGKPLFESSAIVTAVADLVPEKNLVGKPGTWERTLHDQWTCYALTELEMWAWGGMLNTLDFLMPKEQQVPEVVPQTAALFKRGASGLERALGESAYVLGDRFTVTDIIVGYALNLGRGMNFLDAEFANTNAYLDRLLGREHCTLAGSGN